MVWMHRNHVFSQIKKSGSLSAPSSFVTLQFVSRLEGENSKVMCMSNIKFGQEQNPFGVSER